MPEPAIFYFSGSGQIQCPALAPAPSPTPNDTPTPSPTHCPPYLPRPPTATITRRLYCRPPRPSTVLQPLGTPTEKI